jgi:IS5 family transposase
MKYRPSISPRFDVHRKQTRREAFLAKMDRVMPWAALLAMVEPCYPGEAMPGLSPMPLSTMLRIYLMQRWYALTDPAMEDALHDIEPMRRFAGLNLGVDTVPDEMAILKFRRLLAEQGLSVCLLEVVRQHLEQQGLALHKGAIVDAAVTRSLAPASSHDPACASGTPRPRKASRWFFG